jgi:hypothetical protein
MLAFDFIHVQPSADDCSHGPKRWERHSGGNGTEAPTGYQSFGSGPRIGAAVQLIHASSKPRGGFGRGHIGTLKPSYTMARAPQNFSSKSRWRCLLGFATSRKWNAT